MEHWNSFQFLLLACSRSHTSRNVDIYDWWTSASLSHNYQARSKSQTEKKYKLSECFLGPGAAEVDLSLTKMSHKLAVTGNFGGSDAKSESDRICDLISEFYDCRYNVGF